MQWCIEKVAARGVGSGGWDSENLPPPPSSMQCCRQALQIASPLGVCVCMYLSCYPHDYDELPRTLTFFSVLILCKIIYFFALLPTSFTSEEKKKNSAVNWFGRELQFSTPRYLPIPVALSILDKREKKYPFLLSFFKDETPSLNIFYPFFFVRVSLTTTTKLIGTVSHLPLF